MKRTLLLLIASALLWSAAPVCGAVLDQTLPYQKSLTTAPPVIGATTSVTFNFYDSATGGTLLWTESKSMNLLSSTRLISTKLGDSHALNLADFADKQLWVETVVGATAVGTRDKLAPTPYALWSANAAVADSSITGAKLAGMGASSGQALVYNGSSWAPASVGGGSVTTVTAGSPLASSGGSTPNITLGIVGVASGGTGATTAQGAINALAGGSTSGQYLRGNGTNVILSAIQVADIPTLNQNTTGTAANVTGTVAVANGGTGLTSVGTSGQHLSSNGSSLTWTTPSSGTVTSVSGTAPISVSTGTTTPVITLGTVGVANGGTGATTQSGAANAILPSQSGNNGKLLTTDGTISSWLASAATKVPVTAALTATTKTITNASGEYTGSSITLGPGKWNVQVAMLLPDDCNCDMWVRTSLSDSTSSNSSSADIVGANTASGLHWGNKFASLNGSIIINNASLANKTYYYWFGSVVTYNSCTFKLTNFGTTAWGENQMIAFPMNQ